jgi:hypothetical protein
MGPGGDNDAMTVLEAQPIGDRLTGREAGTRVGCWKSRRDGKWLPLFNQVDAGRRELSVRIASSAALVDVAVDFFKGTADEIG